MASRKKKKAPVVDPETGREELTPEDYKMHEYWLALAVMLGFNELAKQGKTLGEKAYFRLLRDDQNKRFVELGGNADVFRVDEAVVEIAVPYGNAPWIRFRAQDIELMRDAVYKHDCERRSSPNACDSSKGKDQ